MTLIVSTDKKPLMKGLNNFLDAGFLRQLMTGQPTDGSIAETISRESKVRSVES